QRLWFASGCRNREELRLTVGEDDHAATGPAAAGRTRADRREQLQLRAVDANVLQPSASEESDGVAGGCPERSERAFRAGQHVQVGRFQGPHPELGATGALLTRDKRE